MSEFVFWCLVLVDNTYLYEPQKCDYPWISSSYKRHNETDFRDGWRTPPSLDDVGQVR